MQLASYVVDTNLFRSLNLFLRKVYNFGIVELSMLKKIDFFEHKRFSFHCVTCPKYLQMEHGKFEIG